MTIAALRALLDEEQPHVRRLPAPRLPRSYFSAKEDPMPEIQPQIQTAEPPDTASPPAPLLTVGQLLAWAAAHPDRELRDHAQKARDSLDLLRARHETDQELSRITAETAALQERLAALQARQVELKPKGRTRDYDPAEVRVWARENGLPVPERGQIPKAVLTEWREHRAQSQGVEA